MKEGMKTVAHVTVGVLVASYVLAALGQLFPAVSPAGVASHLPTVGGNA